MAQGKSKGSTSSNSRLVYSTEQGGSALRSTSTTKPKSTGRSASPGRSASKGSARSAPQAPDDDIVRVWRQTKGRKGKGVTVVTGLALQSDELAKLAGELKKMCGSGGTAKDGVLEIQGDHREKVIDELRRRGWKVKSAGG